ncbi:hypothetical protein CCZ01_07255 [Helicobacter monodelphidis]|nr:hypothetical protein CCZ01_07255 [Helicobacter sp. 15-1451]
MKNLESLGYHDSVALLIKIKYGKINVLLQDFVSIIPPTKGDVIYQVLYFSLCNLAIFREIYIFNHLCRLVVDV